MIRKLLSPFLTSLFLLAALRDAYEQLTEKGVKVVGVSSDNVKSQKSFSDKHKLPYSLVADKEGKVIDAFGVPVIKVGLASRQAYLFKKGKLVWRDLKASTKQQATDVLKQIK